MLSVNSSRFARPQRRWGKSRISQERHDQTCQQEMFLSSQHYDATALHVSLPFCCSRIANSLEFLICCLFTMVLSIFSPGLLYAVFISLAAKIEFRGLSILLKLLYEETCVFADCDEQ